VPAQAHEQPTPQGRPLAAAAVSPAEVLRLAALHAYGVLDSTAEELFDDLTELAAQVCGTPMALISLVDADRQWFKARRGIALCETSRDLSFCSYAVDAAATLVVPDASVDGRFAANPLVTGEPYVRFYAGAPLITDDGHALGTLCVLDHEPRDLSAAQRRQLEILARQVVSQLELRRRSQTLATEMNGRAVAESALRDNRRLLDGILAHTDIAIYAKDLDGRYLLTNAALDRMLGGEAGAANGKADEELFGTAAAQLTRQHDAETVDAGERTVHAEELPHADGSTHSYLTTRFPLRDPDGEIYAVAGVASDVTELAGERAARAESEKRWRDLVERSPGAIAVIDAEARFAYANPQALELYGVTSESDLLGREIMDFVLPGAESVAREAFFGRLSDGHASRGTRWAIRRADGKELVVDIDAALVRHRGATAVQVELRDVTRQVKAEADLQQARDELVSRQVFTDAVLDSIDVGIVACDADGDVTVINRAVQTWSGFNAAVIAVTGTGALADPSAAAAHARQQLRNPDGSPIADEDLPLTKVLSDGTQAARDILVAPEGLAGVEAGWAGRRLIGPGGKLLGAVIAMTDLTASRAQTRALRASEARFQTAFAHDPSGLALVDLTGRAQQVNPAYCRIVGRSAAALLSLPDLRSIVASADRNAMQELAVRALTEPGATATGECRMNHADGSELWTQITFIRLGDHDNGPADSLLVQVEDITERRASQEQLTRQALYDNLTDLPNRAMLLDRAEQALARLARRQDDALVAMLFCDLDGFKDINDTWGHAAGDSVLTAVAYRLREAMRPTDTVARLGGDEFLVLCENLPDKEQSRRIEARLREAIRRPISWLGGEQLNVDVSIGVAFASRSMTATDLLHAADAAMYDAKRTRKSAADEPPPIAAAS
jgi:diguanylate cyclase (GGDEF)-like protein/PAS domain S-box-containing protein